MTTDDIERPALGEYLKSHRVLQGKSQRAVGGTALSSAYICQVEKATVSDVRMSSLFKLAEAYGLPVTSILRDVYGLGFDTEEAAQAQAIGEAVLALPDDRRELTIDWIQYQSHMSQE